MVQDELSSRPGNRSSWITALLLIAHQGRDPNEKELLLLITCGLKVSQGSLFQCCSRSRFSQSLAEFLNSPAKSSGRCRVTNSWATSSRAATLKHSNTLHPCLAHEEYVSPPKSNPSCFSWLVAIILSQKSRTKAVAFFFPKKISGISPCEFGFTAPTALPEVWHL